MGLPTLGGGSAENADEIDKTKTQKSSDKSVCKKNPILCFASFSFSFSLYI